MTLLELLAQQKDCNYISDLKYLEANNRSFQELAEVPLDAYSEQEWKETAFYVLRCQCESAQQARQLLIG